MGAVDTCQICGKLTYAFRKGTTLQICDGCAPFPGKRFGERKSRRLRTWVEVLAEDPDVLAAARLAFTLGGAKAVDIVRESTVRARVAFVRRNRRGLTGAGRVIG